MTARKRRTGTNRTGLAAAALIALCAAGTVPAENIILNPGFEQWLMVGVNLPLFWLTSELTGPGSADTTTVFVHTGRYALRLAGSDTIAFASTIVGLDGARDFLFSGWARSPQFLPGTFTLSWLDSTLALTAEPVVMPVIIAPDYARFYADCSAPDAAAFALVMVVAFPGDTLFVDDIALEPTSSVDEPPPAASFTLEVFPSPASVRIGVSFSVAGAGSARIEIFDGAGRLTRSCGCAVSGCWDGRDMSGRRVKAGVYFVRATRGNEAITKKLILLP